jgi:hypothetical protein
MKPKNTPLPQDDLFKNRLETMIDTKGYPQKPKPQNSPFLITKTP